MAKIDDNEKRLIAVLRRVVGPKVNLTKTNLGLESMKMLEVVVAVENEFEITFPDDAPLGKVTASLRNLKRYVDQLISESGS
jgi:acyl carrier protein